MHDDTAVPRSVGRVLDLLEHVLATRSSNLTTAAAACDLTPTTALRHLRALEARGYLDRDDAGVFTAGPTMLRITAALRDVGPLDDLIVTAQPHLDALCAHTGESTYLAVADGTTATYVAMAESDRAIRHVGWIGQNIPLSGTAVGEAIEHPGVLASRTGAVEPDITAVSCALDVTGTLGVAVSVIGPESRLAGKNLKAAGIALTDAVRSMQSALEPVGPGAEVAR